MRDARCIGAAALFVLSLSACVSSDPQLLGTEIAITPMFETAGIIVATRQDGLRVSYRQAGKGRFVDAHPSVRFDAGHVATSLFDLDPGTTYEVRVGATVLSLTTRSEAEGDAGTPLRVIRLTPEDDLQSIVDQAQPGDEIRLSAGAYRAGLVVRVSGTAGHPIVIRGDLSAQERAKPIEQRAGLPRFDGDALPGGPPLQGIRVDTAHYVILDALEVSHAAESGIELHASRYVTIQDCRIYDNDRSPRSDAANILIHGGGEEAGHHLIQDNHIADREHPEFAYTYRDVEGVVYYGIKLEDRPGWGFVIRRNLVEGHIDGIACSGDEDSSAKITEDLADVLSVVPNREMDVYDNRVVDQRDDAIETDGVFVNQRIFRNYFGRSANATSVSPSLPGPFFFVRNVMTDYYEGCVKLNTAAGRGLIRNVFYYHNTIVAGTTKGNNIMNLWDGTPSRDIVFRNNVFTGPSRRINAISIQPQFTHRPSFDYDLWTISEMERSYVVTKFSSVGLGWEEHGVFVPDARLDASYRPLPDGPAVDRGTPISGINGDYRGKAPDCGAFESGGPR